VVEVMAGQQRHRYRVVTVQRLGKSEVDLDELFSRSGQARLHLVTCGGEFDAEARRYQDNVIAVAAWIAST
jgi:sortase (surface protein transpeptidase)